MRSHWFTAHRLVDPGPGSHFLGSRLELHAWQKFHQMEEQSSAGTLAEWKSPNRLWNLNHLMRLHNQHEIWCVSQRPPWESFCSGTIWTAVLAVAASELESMKNVWHVNFGWTIPLIRSNWHDPRVLRGLPGTSLANSETKLLHVCLLRSGAGD